MVEIKFGETELVGKEREVKPKPCLKIRAGLENYYFSGRINAVMPVSTIKCFWTMAFHFFAASMKSMLG